MRARCLTDARMGVDVPKTPMPAAGCILAPVFVFALALVARGAPLAIVLWAWPAAAVPIKAIEVVDNSKTTDATVKVIAGVEVGTEFTPELADQIRIDLVDSGLFKSVDVIYTHTPGGVILTISAEDKHSWVIAPTYYNEPTNKGGGVGFGENNLFGENKKLLIYAQIATGDSFFVGAYVDPAILGSRFRWQLDTYLLSQRVIEYAAPRNFLDKPRAVRVSRLNYFSAGAELGVQLPYDVSITGRLRGAKLYHTDVALADGAMVTDVTNDPRATPNNVPPPGIAGYDASTAWSVAYDSRANWYGISHGDRYQIKYESALPLPGTAFDYWHVSASMTSARRYFHNHNLIFRAGVTYGQDLPFHQEKVAGGTNLRGYRNDQFRGDFKSGAAIEYSVPLIEYQGVSVRGLGFIDSAYTAFFNIEDGDTFRNYLPGHGTLGAAPFKNTIGIGTRIFIRQIVLPLLGLDVGYGLERGDFEVYLAVGLTDV